MSEQSIEYLRRIARAVERRSVGLVDRAPGRTVLFANVVKAPDGCLWYSWNPNEQQPIAVERKNVRGRLTDLYCYEKASSKGTTIKVRAVLDCGLTTYDIETSLYNADRGTLVTSGKMLVAGLYAAPEAIHGGRMVTIGARPAEDPEARDQVLFLDIYTDDGQVRYDRAPDSREGALSAVGSVRDYLGKSEDPFDNPISNRAEPHEAGGGREKHPSEHVYDDQQPPPQGQPQAPPPRGEPAGSGGPVRGSAANPSGDPRTSGTKTRDGEGQQGHQPLRPLSEAHSALVACPTCGAADNEACFDRDTGEQLEGHHDARVTFAEGLAGDGQALLTVIEPHLQRREGAELRQAVVDLAERAGMFEQAEWKLVRDTAEQYHEDAPEIFDAFREPIDQ